MTADEQIILQTYLLRIAVISSEDEFEEWYRVKARSKKGKSATVADLAEAKAYALGCSDVLLQKEVMASTYDQILRNLAKEFMAERHKTVGSESTVFPPAWLYLPIGPEGPRPWPVG